MAEVITVQCKDGELLEMPAKAAEQSTLLKNMMSDLQDKDGLHDPVPVLHDSATSTTMEKVIEYCKNRANKVSPEFDKWVTTFVKDMDVSQLCDLINLAEYLDIDPLIDIGCETVANIIRSMSAEEIRATFNIPNDFTPEEEADIKLETQWAFE